MSIYTAAITLILIMDPLGNIPLFFSILKDIDPKRRMQIILRETFIAFIILTIFLFFGRYIMEGLHLTPAALSIAGGIVLFLIALQMIFPDMNNLYKQAHLTHEPLVVPIAIPLIAGPATIAIVLLFANQEPGRIWEWFSAIIIASAVFILIMLCSNFLINYLGKRGLIAMERLMGMILTALAIQMLLTGIESFLSSSF